MSVPKTKPRRVPLNIGVFVNGPFRRICKRREGVTNPRMSFAMLRTKMRFCIMKERLPGVARPAKKPKMH